MSASMLAAGISCAGPPQHEQRAWGVTLERRLLIRDTGESIIRPEVRHGLSLPIPGDALPLLADAWRMLVLLEDGNAWRLDTNAKPTWRRIGTEAINMKAKDAPLYVAGGSICSGGFWLADHERRLWAWTPSGRSALASAAIPGDGRIIAYDPKAPSVLLEDGSRLAWLGNRWCSLPGLTDAAATATLRVTVKRGIALGGSRGDVAPGDTLDLSEGEARRLLASGHVAIAPVADAPA